MRLLIFGLLISPTDKCYIHPLTPNTHLLNLSNHKLPSFLRGEDRINNFASWDGIKSNDSVDSWVMWRGWEKWDLLDLFCKSGIMCVFYSSHLACPLIDEELVGSMSNLRLEMHTNYNSLACYCCIIYSLYKIFLLRCPKYFSPR